MNIVAPNEKMRRNLVWFMAHLDAPPTRIHVRGVWHDETGGSAIGAPMLSSDFSRWLMAGERMTKVEWEDVPCAHIGRENDNLCPSCVIFDGEGTPIGERGTVRRAVEFYRWPMRAAMAKLRRIPVRRGRPDLATTLMSIARADGDVFGAIEVLTRGYPAMGDTKTAVAHIAYALNRVQRLYSVQPPVEVAPRRDVSEAQLDAEAEAHDNGETTAA